MAEPEPARPERAANDPAAPRPQDFGSWDPWAADPLPGSADLSPAGAPIRKAPAPPPPVPTAALEAEGSDGTVQSHASPAARPPLPPPLSQPLSPFTGEPSQPYSAADASATSFRERQYPRRLMPADTPARVTLPGRRNLFVNLIDISKGGCCILRKGDLNIKPGDAVQVAIWRGNIDTKITLSAKVCWVSSLDSTARAGLRFLDTSHRLHRQIDDYTERQVSLSVEAWYQTGNSRMRRDLPMPPPPAAAAVQTTRTVQTLPSPTSYRGRLEGLPAPRPPASLLGQAGSSDPDLDQGQRMGSGHRRNVARIAEATGIAAQTLYAWLRSQEQQLEAGDHPADPQSWSTTDKLALLLKIAALNEIEKDQLLHRLGISSDQVDSWRNAVIQANEKPLLILQAHEELEHLLVRDQRQIRRLQRDLRRLEKDAAITEQLLQVARQLQALWKLGQLP